MLASLGPKIWHSLGTATPDLSIICHEVFTSMRSLRSDVRLALRRLAKEPGFTLVVTLTMALGLGVNTAIFSLVHGALLRPFPFPEPDRLVRIYSVDRQTGDVLDNSAPDLFDLAEQSRTLAAVGSVYAWNSQVTGDGRAEPVYVAWVTPDLFDVFSVAPILGRTFLPEEDVAGGDVFKAVISHQLWQGRFGGARDVVGRSLALRDVRYTVVGVMPPGFRYPHHADLWAPDQSRHDAEGSTRRMRYRDRRFIQGVARLAPGVSLEQARQDLDAVSARLQAAFPDSNEEIAFRVEGLRDAEVGPLRPYLIALFGAVAFVLLIVCTNVASLLLARAATQVRDAGIRMSLGADRRRLVRQLLTESLVLLTVLGGGLGALTAWFGIEVIPDLIPVTLPFWMTIELSGPVLLYGFLVALAAGLLCGLYPAWWASRGDLTSVLREGGSRGARGGRGLARLRAALVVTEVAVAVLLLVGAGLMMRSFLSAQRVDPGFEPEGVVTAFVSPYRSVERWNDKILAYSELYRRGLAELRSLPGVTAVGGTHRLPYLGTDGFGGAEEERSFQTLSVSGGGDSVARRNAPVERFLVSGDYFRAMGIPRIAGRDFRDTDTLDGAPVVIVSRRTAERLWPGGDALGQQITWGEPGRREPWRTVVGVVGDVKVHATEGDEGLEVYFPYTQELAGFFHYVVRVGSRPAGHLAPVRRTLQAVDPDTAVIHVRPLTEVMDDSLWQRRLWGILFALFALMALLLAAVGIYGVLAYSVSQRRGEIGVRMALGSTPGRTLRGVIAGGLRLVLGGMALGLVGALVLSRLVGSLLFGVPPNDPWTFAGVLAFLTLVALAACYLPARRAAKTDPTVALRYE